MQLQRKTHEWEFYAAHNKEVNKSFKNAVAEMETYTL